MGKFLKLLIVVTAFFAAVSASAQENADVFKVKTVTGKELTLKGTKNGLIVSPYEGKTVIVEFWGTWCGPCLMSIPHEVALQKKYKDKLRIIAFETTPDLSEDKLKKFKEIGGKAIDMGKVDWFLKNKANSPQARAYFKKYVDDLKSFIKSGEKINYDIVSSKEGANFINYIAKRSGWRGSIPFAVIFKPNGDVSNILQGMLTQEDLEKAYKNATAPASK